MLRRTAVHSYTLSGLRTRYLPKCRVGQGLLSLAPWLNLALLILFFWLLDAKLVLQPGVVVQLPEAPFRGGVQPRLTAVVLALETAVPGRREEIVFFDDERFLVRDERQMERLRSLMVRRSLRQSESALVLQADARVTHGTVVRLLNLAREIGIREVNLATRESAD